MPLHTFSALAAGKRGTRICNQGKELFQKLLFKERSQGSEQKCSLILTGSIAKKPESSPETAVSHRGHHASRCPGCWAGAVLHRLRLPGSASTRQGQRRKKEFARLPHLPPPGVHLQSSGRTQERLLGKVKREEPHLTLPSLRWLSAQAIPARKVEAACSGLCSSILSSLPQPPVVWTTLPSDLRQRHKPALPPTP